MEKPKCNWAAGNCERPATWIVAFVHGNRYRLSCKDHVDDRHKNGAGYWCSELRGFIGDWDHAEARDGCAKVEEQVTPLDSGS